MKVSEVDVLVVGAGPAGVMASAWLARAGVQALMIDQKSAHTGKGHADGLEARTFEILDSFGIGEKCWAKANRTLELCIWDREAGGRIFRESIRANGNPNLSRFHEGTLGQGEIEAEILSVVAGSSVQILRQTTPISLDIDRTSVHDFNAHCINVRLETKGPDDTVRHHNIRSRFLLGCDGAHSWVRKEVGLKMEGDGIDESWGVIDCIPVTNFPDIRKRSIIRSAHGNMMVIPRERRLCRLYVELSAQDAKSFKLCKDNDIVVRAIQGILGQYDFQARIIEWCTVYTAGHRVCPSMSVDERVFLAGDAVHTHTAKAGKGMNLSMQDSFNLGWKLASVIRGVANPEILKTFHMERMQTSKRLVAFDKRLYSQISSKGQDLTGLRGVLTDENTLESGMAVVYPPSIITASAGIISRSNIELDRSNGLSQEKFSFDNGLVIGGRVPSTQLVRHCDVRPVELQQLLPATGQWHLLVFSGDISQPNQMLRLRKMASQISNSKTQLAKLVTTQRDRSLFGTIKTYLIHSAPRLTIEQQYLPELFLPFDEDYGYDYDRVYADSDKVSAYHKFEIPKEGCIVLVRPDQHIALVGSLDEANMLEAFVTKVFSRS